MDSHVRGPRVSLRRVLVVILLLYSIAPAISAQASDPVKTFIARADSLYRASDSQGLAAFVAAHTSVAGAAVGSIVDAALGPADSDAPVNQDLIAFAERISSIYKQHTGSDALLDLVTSYRNFTAEQRALRRRAKALEAKADNAEGTQDFTRATTHFDEAKRIYQTIQDRRSEAIAWGSLGRVSFKARDFLAAGENYVRALEVRRGIEDRILEGRSLNGLGSVHLETRRYSEAIDYYEQAVALRTETGDSAGLGTSLTYLGNTYYKMTGRLGAARDAYAEGLIILEKVGDPTQLYENLNGLANVYSYMNRLQSANDMYVRAVESARSAGNIQGEITCRNNLVLNLNAEYRFSEALEHLRVIESLLSQASDARSAYDFFRNSGETYRGIGDLDMARENFLAAASQADSLGDVTSQIENLLNIGDLYLALGSHDRGLQYANKARALAEEALDHRAIARVERLAAECERVQGHYDQALMHWQSALEKDRLANVENLILMDEMGLANVHAAAGRAEMARTLYFALSDRVDSAQVDLVLNLNLGIADTYEKTRPDSAVYYYERALELLESTRETLTGDAARSDFLSGSRRYYYEQIARYYASLVRTDPDGNWSARAFNTVERAKARGLLDLLEFSQRSKESTTETALLDSLYRLDKASLDYAAQRQLLDGRYQAARDARLKSSLRGLATADIAGIDDVRKALSKDTVLLAYALGDSASLLWVVDRKGHDLCFLPKRADLQTEALRFRDAMAAPGKGDPTLRRSARRLYEALVKPAGPRLAHAKRLVIIPDGALFEVPFEVLLTEDAADGTPWHGLPFLARSFTPIYAPSVSIYLAISRLKKSEKRDVALLAVGDPDFSTLAPEAGRAPLDSLPFTRTEVLGISANLKDDQKDILLGRDAAEGKFKQALRRSSPRMLHLATHGLVDPVEPSASSIVLGTDRESGEDGYLDTMEILSLPLDIDLVVLSACESARGRVSRSEGVVGLSRAFIASGAHGIVASLWAVSDESTSVLMDEFYKKMLGKKRPAGEALNEARFALMEDPDYAHPFYWSPFIVIGSERSPW